MSWEAVSFLILGAVLLAGFAWYERSRPPSQVVALVAALAALAIAGRIAFAAFPNVKPTTDIVIFAGYALGGAPGFAVGALAALVSNFWFGQGPWTPWQMAGWGFCGVLGALLSLGFRNAGRLVLAATCGFAGILYGALMNFSLMATYGGDLSWKHFWVLEGRAVPFEIAHVAGNVVLALIAGPAMVRMLVRFRERFEWERGGGLEPEGGSSGGRGPAGRGFGGALRGGGIAALLLALFLVLGLLAPAAQAETAEQATAVDKALHWLEGQQRPSGGFAADAGRDAGSEMTAWATIALAAAGRNPLDVAKGGKTPIDFLRSHIDEVKDAGDIARTILALEAAGADPRHFAGENLISRLLSLRRGNGSYQGWPATSAYAVLALRGANADSTAPTVAWLRKVQSKDGGWGNEPGDSTAEITGGVLQVLTPGSAASDRALAYLRNSKRPNGGFASRNNLAADSQATAWASQGLLASGMDPVTFGPGKSSFAYLRGLQADDGHFLKASGQDVSRVWVTSDVLVSLSGHFLPVSAPPREPKPKATAAKPGAAPTSEVPSSSSSPSPPIDRQATLEKLKEFGAGGSTAPKAPAAEGAAPSAGSSPSDGGTPSGKGAPGLGSEIAPESATPEGDLGTLPSEALAEETASDEAAGKPAAETTKDSSSSTAGAILLGLLAGCVLFALGLASRRGWMRWRYGL
jgi:energy-coupling factor transport system substrate-specific component